MNFDILTPCHQCGRLIYIPYNVWDQLDSQTNVDEEQIEINRSSFSSSSLTPYSHKQKVDFTLHFINNLNENINEIDNSADINNENISDSQNFNCVQQFQIEKTKQTFTPSGLTYFPLCQDCSTSYSYHFRNFTKLFEKSSFFIDSKLQSIPKGVFDIQYENAITQHPKSKLKLHSADDSNSDINLNGNAIASRLNTDKHYIQIIDHLQPESNNFDSTKESALPGKSFYPFYTASLFRIGTDQHYGTINHLRIGFYDYSQNSILESNLALYSIAHLIYVFKTALCIDQVNIILSSQPSISIKVGQNSNDNKDENIKKLKLKRKGKPKDIDEDDENVEENNEKTEDIPKSFDLIIPEISHKHLNSSKKVMVSKASKKKFSGHYYDNINNAIHRLFAAYILINNAASHLPKYSSPSYIVNLKNRTIGNVSYAFDWKNIEDWTLAMRMLLINLKKIQIVFIRSYF